MKFLITFIICLCFFSPSLKAQSHLGLLSYINSNKLKAETHCTSYVLKYRNKKDSLDYVLKKYIQIKNMYDCILMQLTSDLELAGNIKLYKKLNEHYKSTENKSCSDKRIKSYIIALDSVDLLVKSFCSISDLHFSISANQNPNSPKAISQRNLTSDNSKIKYLKVKKEEIIIKQLRNLSLAPLNKYVNIIISEKKQTKDKEMDDILFEYLLNQ
jgi:hypothetical protein